ncbi:MULTISPECIES: dUTP diphosphatase [unclassified Facklamia]|uniref:dUTP diphosphatase n=1 Tax=Aerococcaceae TaxID=186827 RepID=UPI0013BC1C3E|nr:MULTISPECIES: dUTP diphosphatase [unclassified Facklamia]NEW64992.1 dUTP diphosphatase [Facklamia sp. 252]NEW68453.1 dUTP diphosphatase [Facklamia sp. 253]QQD65590.1 dUTP diphosphatase [Aerococcaceae bacterium zg-252]
MEKIRGFEVVSYYAEQNIQLPKRATHHAAGYDIEAAEDIVLPSFWKDLLRYLLQEMKQWIYQSPKDKEEKAKVLHEKLLKPTLIPTGLKAYMQDDEYLQIINRSSNPLKRFLVLPNSIGIIDSDYYNNESNEGHIFVQMLNFGLVDQKIKKGERIAQGIFTTFLKVDSDNGGESTRTGGFGSSSK